MPSQTGRAPRVCTDLPFSCPASSAGWREDPPAALVRDGEAAQPASRESAAGSVPDSQPPQSLPQASARARSSAESSLPSVCDRPLPLATATNLLFPNFLPPAPGELQPLSLTPRPRSVHTHTHHPRACAPSLTVLLRVSLPLVSPGDSSRLRPPRPRSHPPAPPPCPPLPPGLAGD